MKYSLTALLLAVALPLVACSSFEAVNGNLSGTARKLGDLEGIERIDGEVHFDDSGLAVYQVTLMNEDSDEAWVEYIAHWYDEVGIKVNNPTRHWRKVNIQPDSHLPLRSVAPSMKAVHCEIQIREPRNSAQ
jgi:uncharacterized protein YcfL